MDDPDRGSPESGRHLRSPLGRAVDPTSGRTTADGVVQTPPRLAHLLAKTSRTFALTIPLLPEPTRGEVTVAYLLFRIADTLEDATRWSPAHKRDQLSRLAELVQRPHRPAATRLGAQWLDDPPCDHRGYLELLSELPSVLEFVSSLSHPAQSSIRRHTLRTIERMSAFVGQERELGLQLRDLSHLREYCYAVAGIVGEMLTELFVIGHASLLPVAELLRRDAAAFGEALQLVNILKDSASDSREGRNYLPRGIDRAEVFAMARQDLRTAGGYCRTLHQAGAPRGLVEFTTLPVLLAWATLERVEQRGPGAKLTRPEVATIIQRMHHALDRSRFGELWNRF
jgi:farnesyl-diphosphate farnesyltransferase